MSDPHPRVRWAACNAVGQLASDFGPDLQIHFHHIIIPELIRILGDSENYRLQSHAASAIINFCEDATADVLVPYLNPLLSQLGNTIQQNRKIVIEQSITAVAAIADSVKHRFLEVDLLLQKLFCLSVILDPRLTSETSKKKSSTILSCLT